LTECRGCSSKIKGEKKTGVLSGVFLWHQGEIGSKANWKCCGVETFCFGEGEKRESHWKHNVNRSFLPKKKEICGTASMGGS